MGFKCPKCHKDFGLDRNKLQEHFEENPECATEGYIRTELWKVSVGIKKANKPYGDRGKENVTHRKYEYISPKHIWSKTNLISNDDGSDTVVCSRCGLKAKRFGDKFVFDMRSTRKIQHCID